MDKLSEYEICRLNPQEFDKCSNIWNMCKEKDKAELFLSELKSGNRTTYIYKENDAFLGEISLVTHTEDSDYTIENKRIYLSRLVVKKGYRGNGVGTKLVNYAIEKAKEMDYEEISVGVDLNNYVALKLYVKLGFDKLIFVGEDELGKYLKLIRKL